MTDPDWDVPVEDALEQRQEIAETMPAEAPSALPAEADPGDVAEQRRELGGPDDEEEPRDG